MPHLNYHQSAVICHRLQQLGVPCCPIFSVSLLGHAPLNVTTTYSPPLPNPTPHQKTVLDDKNRKREFMRDSDPGGGPIGRPAARRRLSKRELGVPRIERGGEGWRPEGRWPGMSVRNDRIMQQAEASTHDVAKNTHHVTQLRARQPPESTQRGLRTEWGTLLPATSGSPLALSQPFGLRPPFPVERIPAAKLSLGSGPTKQITASLSASKPLSLQGQWPVFSASVRVKERLPVIPCTTRREQAANGNAKLAPSGTEPVPSTPFSLPVHSWPSNRRVRHDCFPSSLHTRATFHPVLFVQTSRSPLCPLQMLPTGPRQIS